MAHSAKEEDPLTIGAWQQSVNFAADAGVESISILRLPREADR